MRRLILGAVLGWLAAMYYYQSGSTTTATPTTTSAAGGHRSFESRADDVAQEVGEVVGEIATEAKSAAAIEKNSLKDKAERIKDAASD